MENNDSEKLSTYCNKCIFAETEVVFPTSKQTGCELGRLNIFKNSNRARYDDSETFYIIDGVCNTCRGEAWKSSHVGLDLVSTIEREIQIEMDIVLYSINEDESLLLQLVERSVNSCVKQDTILPKKIVVVIKNNISNYAKLYDSIQSIVEPYDILFKLIRIVEEDATIDRCVEIGIDKCKSQFVSVFDLYHKIPSNTILRFNSIINTDLKQIVMIEPLSDYSGLVLSRNVFKVLGKNYNIPIYEKVIEVAEEQNNNNLIITWKEL